MPFTLQVRFSGVCLFVYDRPEGGQHEGPIPVLLPDARNNGKKQRMFDWTVPAPHVGYLRWSTANQVAGAPPADVYHRFDHTHVVIEGLAGSMIDVGHLKRGVIHFDDVADQLACPRRLTKPHDEEGLASPEGRVNALIELQGGRFLPPESGGNWVFSKQLNPPGPQRFPDKARQIAWEADIEEDEVRIVLSRGGGDENAVILRPVDGEDTVLIDIANVCGGDLVDWEEVRPWDGVDNLRPDQDFVWYYRLVQHCDDPDWETHLRGYRFPVPYPDLDPGTRGILVNCLLGAARPFELPGGLAEEDPPDLQANHEAPPAPGAGAEVLDANQPADPIDANYTFAPNTLAMEPVKQIKSNWCWAASAEMALGRLQNMVGLPDPTPDQTEIADQVLGGGTGNPPNNPIPLAGVPGVYNPWPAVDAFPYQGANPLEMIQRQIGVGRPVLSVRETNGTYDWYHMEVVRGWAGSVDVPEVVLNDPQIGKERWVISGFKPKAGEVAVFEDWDKVDWRFWYFLSEV